jgi:hypothetical protein
LNNQKINQVNKETNKKTKNAWFSCFRPNYCRHQFAVDAVCCHISVVWPYLNKCCSGGATRKEDRMKGLQDAVAERGVEEGQKWMVTRNWKPSMTLINQYILCASCHTTSSQLCHTISAEDRVINCSNLWWWWWWWLIIVVVVVCCWWFGDFSDGNNYFIYIKSFWHSNFLCPGLVATQHTSFFLVHRVITIQMINNVKDMSCHILSYFWNLFLIYICSYVCHDKKVILLFPYTLF